jgi:hypothetical protein
MKVFISQPMRGLSDAEIISVREKIFGDFKAEHPEAELIDSYGKIKSQLGMYNPYAHPKVAMLGTALESLAQADVALFAKGWENAPGCRVEQKVASYYDIPKEYVV